MKSKNAIIKGTIILTVFSLFTRIIGFVFRVWLANTLGSEGMGIYQLILSLYILAVTLSTSGISLTVSKLCSEKMAIGDSGGARSVFKKAALFTVLLGFIVAAVVFFTADTLGTVFLRDSRTVLSLKVLAPGLPFMSLSACINGYFFGKRKFLRPASSQLVEQGVKIVSIITLVNMLLPLGLAFGCAAATIGMTLGETVACLYECVLYFFESRKSRKIKPKSRIKLSEIIKQSAPIAANSYINSGLRMVENVLIPSRLMAFGLTSSAALSIFGMLKGMVMPLLVFPSALLTALASVLIPAVAGAKASGNEKRMRGTISKVLQFTLMLGIIIVFVMMFFSYELGQVLYKSSQVGVMLRIMCITCPFIYLEMVVVSILDGLSLQVYTLKINILDSAIRIGTMIILIPFWGFNGYLFASLLSCIICSCLYIIKMLKETHIAVEFTKWILSPSLAAGVSCLAARLIYMKLTGILSPAISVSAILVIALTAYCGCLFLFGCFKMSDLKWLGNSIMPKG